MKKLLALLAALTLLFAFTACTPNGGTTVDTTAPKSTTGTPETDAPPAEKTAVNVIALKGPTGMGLVSLMDKNDAGTAANSYTFSILSAPDDATAEIIKGNYDVAALPTNLAAVLYQKTNQNLEVIALNTLGTLYILEKGDTIHSVADLEGKTIYASGQGAVPEYVLNYILEKNNVHCTVEYLAEHAELATRMVAGDVMLGMLPEPNVTTVLKQNSDVRIALDLTEEWNKVSNDALVMGCLVARRGFVEEHPEALTSFLSEYDASVAFVNEHAADAATLIEHYGIIPKAALAEAAIPTSNMVCMTGDGMKSTLSAFYEALYAANPKSVGGSLPDDNFFYLGK